MRPIRAHFLLDLADHHLLAMIRCASSRPERGTDVEADETVGVALRYESGRAGFSPRIATLAGGGDDVGNGGVYHNDHRIENTVPTLFRQLVPTHMPLALRCLENLLATQRGHDRQPENSDSIGCRMISRDHPIELLVG